MQKILLLGAGRSTYSLIHYLGKQLLEKEWTLSIADRVLDELETFVEDYGNIELIKLDLSNVHFLNEIVGNADVVVSMLPARFHPIVAEVCLDQKKHLLTASYVSKEMRDLEPRIKEEGLIFINEIGVDPGIDHLSAKKVIDEIRAKGGKIKAFETFTGGLVAPSSDNNPWNYKFTWNPRNVVLAGQGGAVKFIQEGTYKYIPYHKLFRRTEIIDIPQFGKFEGYANRDSLKYRSIYGLEDIDTMFRGTLRRPGFCRAWDAFVQLGATDDSYTIPNSAELSHRDFINLFLCYNPTDSVELKFRHYLNLAHDEIALFDKLAWLGIFDDTKVGIENASPGQILQHILEQKWTLEPDDKDMIVMWHKFIYDMPNEGLKELHSSMVIEGKNSKETAMAMTVGLPLGIAAKLVLEKKITLPGVHIPIHPDFYEPILKELEEYGIQFVESCPT